MSSNFRLVSDAAEGDAEKLAVQSSDLLIADSEVMQDYLQQTYRVSATFIPYGADVFTIPDAEKLIPFGAKPHQYFLLIARMQPDNHIEEVIKGVLESGSKSPLLIVGNCKNRYGKYLGNLYASEQIRFLGPIFHKETLDQLRYFTKLYFHGHSSGGTNPSLLEAMAASAPICAHDNLFSFEVLGEDAFYFTDSRKISEVIRANSDEKVTDMFIQANLGKIRTKYNWGEIIPAYDQVFRDLNAG